MNKKILFGVAAMGILGMVGAGVGLSSMGSAKEVKADDPVTVKAGSKIYLDINGKNWFGDNAKVYLWNHQGSVSEEFTFDSTSKLYVATITVDCTSFNIARGETTVIANKWNQSANSTFTIERNKIIAGDYSGSDLTFGWGTYDGGKTAYDGVFYLKKPTSHNYSVYTWEYYIVDGIQLKAELMGSWDATSVQSTSGTIFNPASVDATTCEILKIPFKYYDINNVIVKINDKDDGGIESKKFCVGASESDEIELLNGAYYYNTDGSWTMWDKLACNASYGPDAAKAFILGTRSACDGGFSASDATEILGQVSEGGTYLSAATFNGYTYAECIDYLTKIKDGTLPTAFNLEMSVKQDSNTALIAGCLIASVIGGFGIYAMARKRRAE